MQAMILNYLQLKSKREEGAKQRYSVEQYHDASKICYLFCARGRMDGCNKYWELRCRFDTFSCFIFIGWIRSIVVKFKKLLYVNVTWYDVYKICFCFVQEDGWLQQILGITLSIRYLFVFLFLLVGSEVSQ